MVGLVFVNRLPALVRRGVGFGARIAVDDPAGTLTYADVFARAARVADLLLDKRPDFGEARVALIAPPGAAYVAGQWGTWMAGGVSVPLSPQQTPREWEYILDDCQASQVVASPELADRIGPPAAARGIRLVPAAGSPSASWPPDAEPPSLPPVAPERRALMLYTSGTTSRPKGVVLTHANLTAQVECLTQAWEWREDDRALHVLPLNHTHGVINVLACALWNGACCEFPGGFDPAKVWDRLSSGDVSVFMAVPTIYARLIAAWRAADSDAQTVWSRGAARLRLFVSGSAALPGPVLEQWRAITGHTLLERYGMTEIGMALSNPIRGSRRPGFVGRPLPGVEVRLVDKTGADLGDEEPGELYVRGPGVFREYWGQPHATCEAFAPGRWFRTGDIATRESGTYRILGRASVDIIKTGGEKVSALEVEAVLREHPRIADCAVVGVPDAEWGESVAAVVICPDGATLTLSELRDWARPRLSAHKLPRRLAVTASLPRNAMGKVLKPGLIQLFEA
jgi:malonyl-CoA/methylmalonyl-CoA synthetase